MNNKVVEKYTVSFHLKSGLLLASLLGHKGSTQLSLEKRTRTRISIDETNCKVVISGDMDNVHTAEKEMSKILSDTYYTIDVHNYYIGALFGPNGTNIKRIRDKTKAQIKISPYNPESANRTLEIFGNTKGMVDNAKTMVLSTIREIIDADFNEKRENLYRAPPILRGSYSSAQYVVDQLSPSPQLFFLNIHDKDDNEESFEPIQANDNLTCLKVVHKNGGILAPYNGFLYRAKIIDFKQEPGDIKLLVEFVDFGNILRVSFFKCKASCHFYPPQATPCQLKNVQQNTAFEKNLLPEFKRVLNGTAVIEEVKIYQNHENEELVPITIKISGIGDLGDHLIQRGVAEMPDGPFTPILTTPVNRIGCMQVPYLRRGMGECVQMQVISLSVHNNRKYMYGGNFKDDLIDSLDVAYKCAETVLRALEYNDLERTTLRFTLNDEISHSGPSHGAAFTILMSSGCLRREIPCNKIVTGTIDENGKIGRVGGLREKLLSSKSHKKTQFYVPRENYEEAKSIKVPGLQVISVNNISDLMLEIFQISLHR